MTSEIMHAKHLASCMCNCAINFNYLRKILSWSIYIQFLTEIEKVETPSLTEEVSVISIYHPA